VLLGLLGGLGLVLALVGTVIGVGGAAMATRVIESLLFETARSSAAPSTAARQSRTAGVFSSLEHELIRA
jgi:hypothetical protein